MRKTAIRYFLEATYFGPVDLPEKGKDKATIEQLTKTLIRQGIPLIVIVEIQHFRWAHKKKKEDTTFFS